MLEEGGVWNGIGKLRHVWEMRLGGLLVAHVLCLMNQMTCALFVIFAWTTDYTDWLAVFLWEPRFT